MVLNLLDNYFIAEVGQNHQGDVTTAIDYVTQFAKAGASAVKFQMRDNVTLFDQSMRDMPYKASNSFGDTYGEHRENLELSFEEFILIKDACDKNNVDFICTPFDENSLTNLIKLDVSAIKIASFDLGNLSFLEKIAGSKKPAIISTGGGNLTHLEKSVQILKKGCPQIVILHCVSKYPAAAEDLLLGRIKLLIEKFPEHTVGSSDHFSGILSGSVASMLGAKVFEKHVTFNRANKGTDHSFALELEGFRKFIRDINRAAQMNRVELPSDLGSEPVFKKLGKTLVARKNISKGSYFEVDDFDGKIFFEPAGIPVRETFALLGKPSKKNYHAGDVICPNELDNICDG